MADGGFLVKFKGTKESARCYAVSFDYDKWEYTVNDKGPKRFPDGVKSISIEIEEE